MSYEKQIGGGSPLGRSCEHPPGGILNSTDQEFLMSCFIFAYTTLLHAEAHVLGQLCMTGIFNNLVVAHNVFEKAKDEVVHTYLPVQSRSI